MGRFTNKRILITGGTSGMGLAGAKRIAREGGTVLVTGTNPARIETAKGELPEGSVVLHNDASAADTGDRLAEAAHRFGPLDGLWLNAGIAEISRLEEVDAAFFERMMNINVRGPVLQLAKLAPILRDKASVVVTASTSVYEGASVTSIYSATKGALVALVRCWASELGQRGIRVNTLVPGPIDTNFRDFMVPELRQSFETSVVDKVPLKRSGSADEAAAVALFLLSDEASFVSGSQYAVDGGLTLQ